MGQGPAPDLKKVKKNPINSVFAYFAAGFFGFSDINPAVYNGFSKPTPFWKVLSKSYQNSIAFVIIQNG
jgi:hypothetical protein